MVVNGNKAPSCIKRCETAISAAPKMQSDAQCGTGHVLMVPSPLRGTLSPRIHLNKFTFSFIFKILKQKHNLFD